MSSVVYLGLSMVVACMVSAVIRVFQIGGIKMDTLLNWDNTFLMNWCFRVAVIVVLIGLCIMLYGLLINVVGLFLSHIYDRSPSKYMETIYIYSLRVFHSCVVVAAFIILMTFGTDTLLSLCRFIMSKII